MSETGSLVIGDESVIPDIQRQLASASLVVGFNFKYDLHWLRRYGITCGNARIWDCQIARFLLKAQRLSLRENSLDEACSEYGVPNKISSVIEEYWSKGIDTPDVPRELMLQYLEQDLRSTLGVYAAQKPLIEGDDRLNNLFRLHMADLLVLAEMEWNGLKFNVERCREEQKKVEERLRDIDSGLRQRCPNTPINFDSVDHLSVYLYGGTIHVDRKEPAGVFQTGSKAGQIRYRWVTDTYKVERLVAPLDGSELKKEGLWGTGEDVLTQLKQVEEVKLLRERSKLTKLLDYLIGFPELMEEKDWEGNILHGQFNQCIARTGRLSSSNPNLQNLPEPVLELVETRYAG